MVNYYHSLKVFGIAHGFSNFAELFCWLLILHNFCKIMNVVDICDGIGIYHLELHLVRDNHIIKKSSKFFRNVECDFVEQEIRECTNSLQILSVESHA